jgi:hypothetical protein
LKVFSMSLSFSTKCSMGSHYKFEEGGIRSGDLIAPPISYLPLKDWTMADKLSRLQRPWA